MRSYRGALLAIVALGCLLRGAGTAAQEPEQYSEDAIKAVFLYRFTSFVDWPGEAAPTQQFTIAVMNADGVAEALRRLLPDHLIKNRRAQVRSIQRLRDLGDARILYVGAGSAAELSATVTATAGRPVLVVSDVDRGLERGSAINFLMLDRHVRFEVSLPAASRAGLRISSELLSVATRVMSGDNNDNDHSRDSSVVATGAN